MLKKTPNVWNRWSKRQRSQRAREPLSQFQTLSKCTGLWLMPWSISVWVLMETPWKGLSVTLGVLQNWKSTLADTWTFASSSRYLCWARWRPVNVLLRFLLNYKVCKLTVRSDDSEESKREKVLKINQDRACKTGVLSFALPKVFDLTLSKSSARPFYQPPLKSSAWCGSSLLRCGNARNGDGPQGEPSLRQSEGLSNPLLPRNQGKLRP